MKAILENIQPRIREIFTHLHTHPEISWKEIQTTNYLQALLQQEGFQVETFSHMTGLVVTMGSGKPVVGLRTDIDALWQEVDGEFKANHSCGHDGHMTMAIGTLLVLKEMGLPTVGTIKVLFQPAEEKGTGALAFLEEGLVDDCDFLYGVHLRPIQELLDGEAAPAILHGSAKMIYGEIIGTDTHGARPHLGTNAIEVMAMLVRSIQSIHVDPMVPHSAKMTMFQAGGESANIIPGNAVFSMDVRAQTNEVMQSLMDKIETIVKTAETLFDVQIRTEIKAEIAAAQVDSTAVSIMEEAIKESIGEAYVQQPIVTPGGEDFHFYTLHRPHIKATMLGLGCDLTPGLHHPQMTFNEDRLLTGIEILSRTVMHTFKHLEKGK